MRQRHDCALRGSYHILKSVKIETLEDWLRVGCGCLMPACPVPQKVCRSAARTATSEGLFNPSEATWKIYKKSSHTQHDHSSTYTEYGRSDTAAWKDTQTTEYDSLSSVGFYGDEAKCGEWQSIRTEKCTVVGHYHVKLVAEEGGSPGDGTEMTVADVSGKPMRDDPSRNYPDCTFEVTQVVTTYAYNGDAESWEATVVTTYSVYDGPIPLTSITRTDRDYFTIYENGLNYAGWVTETKAKLLAIMAPESDDCYEGEACSSAYTQTAPVTDATSGNVSMSMTAVKYRWQIPATWEGSYFKITWQELTEYDGDTEDDLGDDITVTWEGPGSPDNAEDKTWFTPWNVMAPPAEPGTTRLVNLRFECYKSAKLGNKPQIAGESYDAPVPDPAP